MFPNKVLLSSAQTIQGTEFFKIQKILETITRTKIKPGACK